MHPATYNPDMADRFRVVEHYKGGWNVIDDLTGGPVEIDGKLLYRLPLEDAEDLADALTYQDAKLLAPLAEIVKRPANR